MKNYKELIIMEVEKINDEKLLRRVYLFLIAFLGDAG